MQELESITDRWVYFLKGANHLEEIPQELGDPAIREAFEVANQQSWSSDELDIYLEVKTKADSISGTIEEAIEKGEQIGIQKGREDR